MRHAAMALVLAVVLGVAIAPAGGGELTAVTKGLEADLGGMLPPVPCGSARGASGLRSDKAVLATVPVGGGQTVKVALDYSQDSLRQPDLARFDFAGTGAFNDTAVAKIRWTQGPGQIGPATLTAERGGQKLAAAVRGVCYSRNQGGRPTFVVQVGLVSAAEGTCQFGEKSYAVRVVDGSGNLSLRDGLKLPVSGEPYGAVLSQNADKVFVKSGDNKVVTWAYHGQPLRVDGQWYTATISADQTSITATKLDVPMAELRPSAAKWGAMLVGHTYVLELSGGTEPIRIPADAYALGTCAEYAVRNDGRPLGQLLCTGDARPALRAEPDKTVQLPALTPLRGKLSVRQNGDTVVFSFEAMKTASGLEVSSLTVADAQGRMNRPDPPKVKVFDSYGKLIYQADLRYG